MDDFKNSNNELGSSNTNEKGRGMWPIILFIVVLIVVLVVAKRFIS